MFHMALCSIDSKKIKKYRIKTLFFLQSKIRYFYNNLQSHLLKPNK